MTVRMQADADVRDIIILYVLSVMTGKRRRIRGV